MVQWNSKRFPGPGAWCAPILLAVAVTLASAPLVTAQGDKEGIAYGGYQPPNVGPWDVILFEHPNYQGAWVRYSLQPGMRQRLVPQIAPALEDKVSSIQVGQNVGVRVFQHRRFFADSDDGCEKFTAWVPSLGTNTQPLDDKLSSLIVFPKAAGDAFGLYLLDQGTYSHGNLTVIPLPEWEAEAEMGYPSLDEFNLNKNINRVWALAASSWRNQMELLLYSDRNFSGAVLTLPKANEDWDMWYDLERLAFSDTAASVRLRWKGPPAGLGRPFPSKVQPDATAIGWDLPGRDIRSFETDGTNDECWQACAAEPGCRAYTWVKPGVQGPRAACWLKSSVPPRVANSNCVSAWLKDAAPAPAPAPTPAPPSTPAPDPRIAGLGKNAAAAFLAARQAAACPKLVGFVTASPLPTTGVGWDYSAQLQATGGVAPLAFLTSVVDPTGKSLGLSCNSGGPYSGPPSYFPGKLIVDGLTLACDGRITGQPKSAGYFTVSITVTDKCRIPQQVEKTFVLQVKGPS